MRQFEITLPMQRNDGSVNRDDHDRFATHLLNAAGGFTRGPVSTGVWRDDATGEVFNDPVVTYRVALNSASAWPSILEKAGEIFSDQLALFHADLGDAWIDANAHHHAQKEAA